MNSLISAITLIGMGSYGLILYHSSKLGFYMHPRFFEESYIASIVALIVGFISFTYFIINENNKTKHLAKYLNKNLLIIITSIILSFIFGNLFLLIALITIFYPDKKGLPVEFVSTAFILLTVGIGIFLPPKTLSSITASQRSIDLNSINLTEESISAVQNFNKSTTNYSLGDWIAMQNFNPDPNFYIGKEVKVSGFLYKPSNLHLDTNTVIIARFIITCCAVDARPVGLRLNISNHSEFKENDWIEAVGKFNLDNNNELIIIPESINIIEEPSNPYIY